jgi:hypothetical protein
MPKVLLACVLLLDMTSHHPARYWLLDSVRDLSVAGLEDNPHTAAGWELLASAA